MKTIIIAFLVLLSPLAQAKEPRINLLKKASAKKEKILSKINSVPLLKIYLSPENPKQGDLVSIYAELTTEFTDQETVLQNSFDGQLISSEHPTSRLWIFRAGPFSEISSHTFRSSVFVRDTGNANQIRQSIQLLDTQIATLNTQIAQATDPDIIAQLTAQRDAKVNAKNTLLQSLAALLHPIGEESLHFQVAANDASADFPHITSVNPNLVRVRGGTNIAISGRNFTANPSLLIGNIATAISGANATNISAITPNLGSEGLKDIELRFVDAGKTKNAILKNAFYASNAHLAQNMKPVAIAGGAQNLSLGSSVSLNGSASYDINNDPFDFEWKVISAPENSGLPIGTVYSTQVSFSLTPAKPGNYLFQLVTKENNTSDLFASDPSLTIIAVSPNANNAPSASAGAISAWRTQTVSSQVSVVDPDDWQSHSYRITKESSFGTATISNTGLLSFTAGLVDGTDSIKVLVFDNGTPPLSGEVSIPVTVFNNQAPRFDLPGFYINNVSEGIPVLGWLNSAGTVSDPDGTVVDCIWDFGGYSVQGDPADSCFAEVDSYILGDVPVTLTIVDNLGATASQSGVLHYVNAPIPDGKFTMDPITGSAPLAVNFDASSASIPGGGVIQQYRYRFGDAGSTAFFGSVQNHTYLNPGTYKVSVRQSYMRTSTWAVSNFVYPRIYIGASAPSYGTEPVSQARFPSGREVLVGGSIAMDGSVSFDPILGGGITNHAWNFGEYFPAPGQSEPPCGWTGCSATGANVSHAYQLAHNYSVSLTTTNASGGSKTNYYQVYAVNQGHAPRCILKTNALQGVAPLTVNFDASRSFDFDGSIASYRFQNGIPGSSPISAGTTSSFTYTNPGTYYPSYEVTDNHGNIVQQVRTVIVYPSKREMPKKRAKIFEYDGDHGESQQKQILTNACGAGDGQACFELSKIYLEEGDSYAAEQIKQRACSLGHQAACERGERR